MPDRRLRARSLQIALAAAGGLAGVLLLGWVAWSWEKSRLPDRYNAMEFGTVDYGGGPRSAAAAGGHAGHSASGPVLDVSRLTGPRTGRPDYAVTLTASRASARLASGKTVDVLAFNGRVPGPELRVRRHDLVEVTLVNRDVDAGVSIHWHGVDVPNAQDGVSGVTQNAVMPGERYTYRFRADQAGTFWYHSHQVSSRQVKRGLFGPLVVLPDASAAARGLDLSVVAHTFSGWEALGTSDTLERRAVAPGTPVRLRLVNTDSVQRRFALGGTPFRVVAVDGTDLNRPEPISGRTLELAAGGRYDLAFTMPPRPVKLALLDSPAAIAFSRAGDEDGPAVAEGRIFDPVAYGAPKRTPFGASSRFDRRFVLDIDQRFAFFDGRFGKQWSVNGEIYPDTPMYVVRPGDLVKLTIRSETKEVHPMHLHGHHMLVLSRNGRRVSGSPWWVDTLDVRRGETYEVAFRADNPGLWMLHCHNLVHAADGLGMHVAYEGVTTPFELGEAAGNEPE